jgi:hypothetical protein
VDFCFKTTLFLELHRREKQGSGQEMLEDNMKIGILKETTGAMIAPEMLHRAVLG